MRAIKTAEACIQAKSRTCCYRRGQKQLINCQERQTCGGYRFAEKTIAFARAKVLPKLRFLLQENKLPPDDALLQDSVQAVL